MVNDIGPALKQISFNISPGLDGLPYEVYLMLSHKFVQILMDIFNRWFAQRAIGLHYQECDPITKEIWLACLKEFTWLQTKHKVKDFGLGLSEPFADCHQRSDRTWAGLRCEGKIDSEQFARL